MEKQLTSWNGGIDSHWMPAQNISLAKALSLFSIQKFHSLYRVLRLDILRRGIFNDSENSIAEISDGPVLAILLSKGVYSIYEDLESIHRAFCRTCFVTM